MKNLGTKGTPLFRRLWTLCRDIPKGKVAAYNYLAQQIGKPKAGRVVAMAMARNPYAPDVPCHRVIRADGSLGGYSAKGGVARKRSLLTKEGIRFDPNGKVLPDFVLKSR